jgi:hypothetical protein
VALALASLALTFAWLKPAFNAGQAEYGRMYAAWGATPGAMLARLATHPLDALAALLNTPGNPVDTLIKRQLWVHLLLPVSLLPLAAPAMLMPAIPVLFEHLLSERRHQHTIVFQYAALTIPFFVTAGVLGFARVAGWLGITSSTIVGRTRATAVALAVVTVSLGANAMFGPLAGREIFQRAPRNESVLPGDYDVTMRPFRARMLARVPREGAVVAGFEFLAGLARHPQLHSIHHVITGLYTYSERPYPMPHDVRALVADMAAQSPNLRLDSGARLRSLIADNDLHPVDAAGSALLFLRGARDTVELMRFMVPDDRAVQFVIDDQLAFLGADPPPVRAVAGETLDLRARWGRVGPVTRTFLSSIHLYPDDAFSNPVEVRNCPIGYGILPVVDWPADSVMVETVHFELSTELAPGRYRVAMTAFALDSLGRTVGSQLELRVPVRNQQLVEVGSFELVRAPR